MLLFWGRGAWPGPEARDILGFGMLRECADMGEWRCIVIWRCIVEWRKFVVCKVVLSLKIH